MTRQALARQLTQSSKAEAPQNPELQTTLQAKLEEVEELQNEIKVLSKSEEMTPRREASGDVDTQPI